MSNPPNLLATAEVCAILSVRPSTISRWVESGRIKTAHKLPGHTGAFLFDPAEVDRVQTLLTERQAS